MDAAVRPPGAISPALTRTFLAVLREHERTGRCTVRQVLAATGLRSTGSVHRQLWTLRRLGLIAWEDGRTATIHPTVARTGRRAA